MRRRGAATAHPPATLAAVQPRGKALDDCGTRPAHAANTNSREITWCSPSVNARRAAASPAAAQQRDSACRVPQVISMFSWLGLGRAAADAEATTPGPPRQVGSSVPTPSRSLYEKTLPCPQLKIESLRAGAGALPPGRSGGGSGCRRRHPPAAAHRWPSPKINPPLPTRPPADLHPALPLPRRRGVGKGVGERRPPDLRRQRRRARQEARVAPRGGGPTGAAAAAAAAVMDGGGHAMQLRQNQSDGPELMVCLFV